MVRSLLFYCGIVFLLGSCSSRPPVQEQSSEPMEKQVEAPQPKKDIWAWDYTNGPRGPQNWAMLNPQYDMCATGQAQSPVNLVWHKPTGPNPLSIN